MKYLHLIRHAKTSWEHPELPDRERPLTETGKQDAQHMAQQLKDMKIEPDCILCSPAVRALDTATIFANEFNFPLDKILIDEQIYSGGVEELIEVIKHLPSSISTVLCIGHNPNLTWLSHYLCEEARMNIPTCGIVSIKFHTRNWGQITNSETQLISYIHPQHEPPHETS